MTYDMASIISRYMGRYKVHHGSHTTPDQWSALNAITGCRTEQYGRIHLSCNACAHHSTYFQSCGHRSCNRCQNHNTTQWLDRQITKLLPVEYFMVTFTLPCELRALAYNNQRVIYALLFECAVATLTEFGVNDKALAAELAMTAVLHTHTRKLDYHPHVHIIVPGGGINKKHREWEKISGKYLFNGFKLASVFRGKLLNVIEKSGLKTPITPTKWVVQCQHVGHGLPALKYLSRYLYRGVLSNKNIVNDDGTFVTFKYKESKTGKTRKRKVKGEEFIRLILQHTLPKGFRRARDYGFLHGNAKRILKIVQWVLKVVTPPPEKTKRPDFICEHCQSIMAIVGFGKRKLAPG